MEIILLSGNNANTKDWIENLSDSIKSFGRTHIQYYKHWTDETPAINFDVESGILKNYLSNKKDYVIIAKSAGVVLALKSINEGNLHPKGCIFMGLPYSWTKNNRINILGLLNSYNIPTIFIQNNNDPLMSFDELFNLLSKIPNKDFRFVKFTGNTHDYCDFEKIKKELKKII
ncbi:MAG: hypothetical protein M1165_00210 [Candidatus Pacearchaeota archaeon]|nr:hypothetical protein [Candidatus Pacearchaeota archaeon]MDE1848681.1 hypothetical protein [Nanoarchaeota archaeon]